MSYLIARADNTKHDSKRDDLRMPAISDVIMLITKVTACQKITNGNTIACFIYNTLTKKACAFRNIGFLMYFPSHEIIFAFIILLVSSVCSWLDPFLHRIQCFFFCALVVHP